MSEWWHRPYTPVGGWGTLGVPVPAELSCEDCAETWPCSAEQVRLALDAERARTTVLETALRAAAVVLDQSGGDKYAIEARGILRTAIARTGVQE